jgi:hypothetical protein
MKLAPMVLELVKLSGLSRALMTEIIMKVAINDIVSAINLSKQYGLFKSLT